MDKKFEGLIYILIILGLATLIADVEKDKIESYFNSLVGLINLIVMGLLAFYTFNINKKQMEISRYTLNMTRRQMIRLEMNETNALLGKLDEYIRSNEIVQYMCMPHLSYGKKKTLLITNRPGYFKGHELNEKIGRDRIDHKIRYRQELTEDEQELFNEVTIAHFNSLPSSATAFHTLKDAKNNFKHLKEFKTNNQFYRFMSNSQMTKEYLDKLEYFLEIVFKQNKENDDVIYPSLKMNSYDADSIYFFSQQTQDFLVNLKTLIISEQQQIIEGL
ncbi:hypothetical protein [Bacillus sp. V5-8f]|uniref:hypothetical protein n=1 Tax=Bacillus sp. V5-8f TaxID=2053044 RepID=UPI000C7932BB|nr:hypothetical protein [Bacillus sp. V5-8f]PLT33921.1 hypothetical protein CUU64_12505 [Bacillus sp. V5-8f]